MIILLVWIAIVLGVALAALTLTGLVSGLIGLAVWLLFIAAAVILNVESVRLKVLSKPLLGYVKAVLPPMSQTEKDAIEGRYRVVGGGVIPRQPRLVKADVHACRHVVTCRAGFPGWSDQ